MKLEVIVKLLNITVKKTKNKNLCKKDETFNDKQEKCISSPQCKSSEYYNQRLKRCLTKRRCYPPKEFNEKTEKCEEKVNEEINVNQMNITVKKQKNVKEKKDVN